MPKEYDFELVRGDTLTVEFGITDGSDNPLNIGVDDDIIFTVKQTSIQKFLSARDMVYENGVLFVSLTHLDTNELSPRDYDYDIQVMLNGDEFVDTPWRGRMTLEDDVTRI